MKTQTLVFPSHTKLFISVIAVVAVATAALFALSASAVEGAAITTTVHTAAHGTTTQAAIGTLVHANAAVATTTGTTTPTGTVDFNLYANTSCTGTPTTHAGVVLVNGIAESATTSVPAAGLSYRVKYNGDANNVVSEGACTSLTATGPNAAITTALSTTTAVVGTSVFDTATLQNVTSNASGTVAYTVYTNNSCSAGAQSAGTTTVVNAAVPNSNSIQFNTPGTFYWQARYSGDSLNAAATSTCGSEVLNILATSTPTGRIIVDKVTVPAGATTTFNFDASGGAYNDFSLADGSQPNDQTLVVGTYSISENSKSGWTLTSASCSRNSATSTTYTQGSSIVLNSGDVVSCVFTNTKATSTDNGGGGKPDNGHHKGFLFGLPFGILKKVFDDVGLPSGILNKFGDSWKDFIDDDFDGSDFSHQSSNDDDNENGNEDDDDDNDDSQSSKEERKAEKERIKQERQDRKDRN